MGLDIFELAALITSSTKVTAALTGFSVMERAGARPNKNIEDLTSIVAAKFASGESVVALLTDAALVGPDWLQRERILVIVQCGSENALFVLLSGCYPPTSFLDLSIERILPIDKNFKCEIDDGSVKSELLLHLTITSRKPRISYELHLGSHTATFVETIFRSVESTENLDNPQFTWIRKYSGTKKNSDLATMADMDSPDLYVPRQNIAQGVTPITARDNLIKYHLQMKEHEYTFAQPFSIFVGTWNVNGQSPSISLQKWLSTEASPPDIYAVGFQELDLSKEAFLFHYTQKETEWLEAVEAGIDSRAEYKKVYLVRLIGMMLIVLVKKQFANFIRNIDCNTVGTGIMGKMGNKGGVSIRFDLHKTSICFVNSHLAAHVEEYERRNQDFQEICNRTTFMQFNPPKHIKDHDQIYWLGDLNYRITEMDHNTVKKLLKDNNIQAVLVADQLKSQHKANNVLNGFTEGVIDFQPTYKYDPGTDEWDSSEKERAPAWCDRIFWKGDSINQQKYTSHPELNISDHKPVSGVFLSEIKVVDMKKYRKVHEEVIKKLDKMENEFLPHVTVEPTEIIFNNVKYLEGQLQEVCIANTGQVPVKFEFIKKLEESSYCKDWLNIEPNLKQINPGEKCDVKLEVFVNKKSAFKLNLGEDKLYDILVLHLDGGKDIFITVNGTYIASCFGSSIETLIHLKTPVHEVHSQKAIDTENSDSIHYRSDGYIVPKEIWYLVDHIYKYGLKQPNIFKQPGLHSELLQIRDWLDYGSASEFPGTIHSVVEALLLFLESTAEPIIPYNHHYACLNAAANYLQCKQIIMHLPEYKKNVFLYLCCFLQEVLNYSSDNGTDSKTLATLFGSIFLRDAPQNKSKVEFEKKKMMFVHHFLVNDQSDILRD